MLPRTKLHLLNHGYNTTFLLSLVCYTLSLCFVSAKTDTMEYHGYFLLLFGWMSFGLNGHFFCWLANLVYIICSCIMIRKAKSLFWVSLLLPFLGVLMLFEETFPNFEGGAALPFTVSTGYWLWLVALLLMTLACILLRVRNARKEPEYSRRFSTDL